MVITCYKYAGTASKPQNLFTVNFVGDHNIGNHSKYSGQGITVPLNDTVYDSIHLISSTIKILVYRLALPLTSVHCM